MRKGGGTNHSKMVRGMTEGYRDWAIASNGCVLALFSYFGWTIYDNPCLNCLCIGNESQQLMWPLFKRLVTSSFMLFFCHWESLEMIFLRLYLQIHKLPNCLGMVYIIACRSCPNWLHLGRSPQSYNIGLKGFHHFLIHLLLLLQLPNGFFGCFLCCNFGCILPHVLNCFRSLSITIWSQSCLPLFPLASLGHQKTQLLHLNLFEFPFCFLHLSNFSQAKIPSQPLDLRPTPRHSYFPRLIPTLFRTSYIHIYIYYIITSFIIPSPFNHPKMDISWHFHHVYPFLSSHKNPKISSEGTASAALAA